MKPSNATIPANLFVLEMANNHMGDLDHGIAMIRRFGEECRGFPEFRFAFKLQYRDLDSFIHPSMRGREDVKYVKRFSETRLGRAAFDRLVEVMREEGFLTMATPFDNASVDAIEEQALDIVKIASCSFTDWPLLERVVRTNLPIIASTAGASLDDMDRVVSFLSHRGKDFAILHCVGEYPTADDKLHLSQIDLLRRRYPGVRVGFSTHEDPSHTDLVKLAIAKGADLFEKHVALPTERYAANAYSATPEQVRAWLEAARWSRAACGVGHERLPTNPQEAASLRSLRRGVFVRRDVPEGHRLTLDDVYFAFPPSEDQVTANDWSKYTHFTTTSAIAKDSPVHAGNASCCDERERVWSIAQQVKAILEASKIALPGGVDLEISHHYGLDRFDEYGLTMLTVVNRGYCKKILVSLPGQKHPEQFHQRKEESFLVLFGELHLTLDGVTRVCKPGDLVNVEPGVKHAFVSPTGAVVEEISSTHFPDDSYYTDATIQTNRNRKTLLTYWMGSR
jgi:sialic acid synthase SpsE/mannose-6-phosphate isomerase-like protein (cupin superfamily)